MASQLPLSIQFIFNCYIKIEKKNIMQTQRYTHDAHSMMC